MLHGSPDSLGQFTRLCAGFEGEAHVDDVFPNLDKVPLSQALARICPTDMGHPIEPPNKTKSQESQLLNSHSDDPKFGKNLGK